MYCNHPWWLKNLHLCGLKYIWHVKMVQTSLALIYGCDFRISYNAALFSEVCVVCCLSGLCCMCTYPARSLRGCLWRLRIHRHTSSISTGITDTDPETGNIQRARICCCSFTLNIKPPANSHGRPLYLTNAFTTVSKYLLSLFLLVLYYTVLTNK